MENNTNGQNGQPTRLRGSLQLGIPRKTFVNLPGLRGSGTEYVDAILNPVIKPWTRRDKSDQTKVAAQEGTTSVQGNAYFMLEVQIVPGRSIYVNCFDEEIIEQARKLAPGMQLLAIEGKYLPRQGYFRADRFIYTQDAITAGMNGAAATAVRPLEVATQA